MVDQVAIFFLAGHETSASALAWTLYLMALYPEWQDAVAQEAEALNAGLRSVSKFAKPAMCSARPAAVSAGADDGARDHMPREFP